MKQVRIVFADMNGCMKGKLLPVEEFAPDKYFGTPRSVLMQDIEGGENHALSDFAPESGDVDMRLVPDMASYRPAPGNDELDQVIVDLCEKDGSALAAAPREVLKRVLKHYQQAGLTPHVAMELEFYLLHADGRQFTNIVDQPYADMSALDVMGEALNDLMSGTADIGLKPEGVLSEAGPGQLEINFRPDNALAMADHSFYFKQMVKEVARRHAMKATFLAKPLVEHAGSGAHVHLSLQQDGRNIFEDESVMNHFLAGLVTHQRELYALMAPNPNSYRRIALSHGYVPQSATHGEDDRRVALRTLGSGQDRRIENRIAGSDANPYLLLAAILAAGWDGLQRHLEVDSQASQQAASEPFADNLPQALDNLEQSHWVSEVLGGDFVAGFVAVKRAEWQIFQEQITDWERQTYGTLL